MRPLDKPRFWWKDGIQIKCFEIEYDGVECMCLAQAWVLCHSFLSTIVNFYVHKNQICGSHSGDSEGSHLMGCDAVWSGKCVLRGRQQVYQKHLIHIYHTTWHYIQEDYFWHESIWFFYDRLATPETLISYLWVPSEQHVYSVFVVACSAQAKGTGDVCYVPVPCQEQGVGVATHICICIPQPIHRWCGVHCVYQHQCQVSNVSLGCSDCLLCLTEMNHRDWAFWPK